MKSITSKQLHEQTASLLDQVKQGQRLQVVRGGEADALLIPAIDQIDPPWDEIMVEVRKARTQAKRSRPNPILAEEKSAIMPLNYADCSVLLGCLSLCSLRPLAAAHSSFSSFSKMTRIAPFVEAHVLFTNQPSSSNGFN
jgi:antitoxin (DNA-binding transcriptional repressor) of toxin-antitoxin stability system